MWKSIKELPVVNECLVLHYRWGWVGTVVVSHCYGGYQLVSWRRGECRSSVSYVWLLPSETPTVRVSIYHLQMGMDKDNIYVASGWCRKNGSLFSLVDIEFIMYHYFSSDPLPKAVLVAYRARRNLMSNTHGSSHCIRQCDRAGRLLRESLKLSYAKQNEQIVQVSTIVDIYIEFFSCRYRWRERTLLLP